MFATAVDEDDKDVDVEDDESDTFFEDCPWQPVNTSNVLNNRM